MKPEIWISIVTCCITLFGMFMGPRIAVRMALKQFRSQKWWELQTETYGRLLQSLAVIKHHFDGRVLDSTSGRDGHTHPKLDDEFSTASADLHKFVATGGYYFSDDTNAALRTFMKNWALDYAGKSFAETATILAREAANCFSVVEREANVARREGL
jgi:hypothetical protein